MFESLSIAGQDREGPLPDLADHEFFGGRVMFLSWFRSSRKSSKRSEPYRPMIDALDERITPYNAHFVSASRSVAATTGALTVKFHEAGLGNSTLVNATLTADANATYQWFNHGGNKPQGVPFNVNQTISVSGTFTSDQNGQIKGSLTVNPPSVSAFLSTNHAANWTPHLTVSYTNVVVTDTTNGVSTATAGFNLDQPLTVIQ